MMKYDDDALKAFLHSDRQWHRTLRIAHAEREARLASERGNDDAHRFWRKVVNANLLIPTRVQS